MFIEFPENPEAVSDKADPLLLLRPEGRWHEAGFHEKTAPQAKQADVGPTNEGRRPVDVAGRLKRRRPQGTWRSATSVGSNDSVIPGVAR